MKNNVKRILYFFSVLLFSVLATIGMVSLTFASRIEDYANSPNNLVLIMQYNRAMETCMGNSLSSFTYDNSGSGQYKVENIQRSYDQLLAKKYFFKSTSGALLYSHEFEQDVSQGSYDGGVFGSGNDDGKMYCGENESKVFHNAMNTFGIAENKENLKSLYCNGESSGIYTISKKKYDSNYKVIEEDSNCSTNFDLFVEYAERGEENPAYSLSVSVSSDPVGHYQRWFSENVGSFSSLSSSQNEALTYAKNRHDFMTLCKPSGPFDTDPQSKNEVLVYDSATPNKKVYYTIGVGMDDKFYTEINSDTKKTCVEMADGMTKEGAEAVASAPMVEIDENREEDVRACYKDAEDALKSTGTLYIVKQRSWGIYYLADILLKQAETFRSNGYKVTGVQENDTEYGVQETETIEFRDSTVQQFLETMNKNVADAGGGAALESFVAYMTEFSNAMVSFREKSQAGGLTDEEKEDFDAWVENCTTNVNTFNTEVVEKLNALYESAKADVEGTDVNSMFRSGTIPAGESKIKDSVDNFYSFNNSNNISCLLVDDVLSGYARQMAEITGGDITIDPFTAPEHTTPVDIDPDLAVEDPCYNAGIEGMSWILCPSLNNMVEASDGISSLIDKWLAVDSDYYNNTSNVRTAWGYFRDMANIAVIIVLLVIIVSQVTGYGIDNYGIKKMLPRLLVMAVLINLSFIICQLAVDISNILGSGLNELFKSIGLSIDSTAGAAGFVGKLMTGIFGALGVAGAVGGFAITFITLAESGGTVMIVIFAVLLLVSALLAIVMFFLALGARLIIVIMFTAISPLAFACYILPNTQSLFKKWWDVFKAALVVYPICGALYGMSFIIKAIIFQDGGHVDLWLAMIGIIAPFLPFMIIPSLTKGALAGLGAIGGTLAMLGNGAKRGISNFRSQVQDSDAFKSQMERGQRNMNAKMAGFNVNKKTGELLRNKDGSLQTRKMSRFGKFLAGGDVGMTAARKRVLSDERARNEERDLMGAGFMAGIAGVEAQADKQRDANAEAMLGYGKATYTDEKGKIYTASSGNLDSVAAYHSAALRKYNEAKKVKNEEAMREAASEIRAAQNILSRTDGGRGKVQASLEAAISGGYDGGTGLAAQHLQENFGDLYKSKNRGANSFIMDLAGGTTAADAVKRKIEDGSYALAGADKYDQSTLVGADDRALEDMSKASLDIAQKIAAGEEVDAEQRKKFEQIRSTAAKAIEMYDAGRLSIKQEALHYVEDIAGVKAGGGVKVPAAEGEVLNVRDDGDAASKLILGAEAERQFNEGRRDGSIKLPK